MYLLIISVGRIELPFSASKTGVLPLNETELCWCLRQESNLLRHALQAYALPVELQRQISAARIELTLLASETSVLPLDEAEMVTPAGLEPTFSG